jgi:uncharacterized damage-inducible protein DinB
VSVARPSSTGGTPMPMTADQFAAAVTAEAAHEMHSALGRIQHCLDQLTDEQVRHRPADSQNSIANLLLHLSGNLRQWVIAGLGGAADVRDRPAEFADRGGRTKDELWRLLESTVTESRQVLQRLSADELLRVRRIQGFEVSGLRALFDTVPHLRGHTQEIVFRTRLLLGDRYRFAWAPQTKEEGAPSE